MPKSSESLGCVIVSVGVNIFLFAESVADKVLVRISVSCNFQSMSISTK